MRRATSYFTGLMERVVDGPQQASWAPGITAAMNLRGQKIDCLVKPTLSVYAPFYLSSRGYSVTVGGTWPGLFDFASANPERVAIEFEGPSLSLVIDTAATPAELVRAHALDAGPPFLPPKWIYSPWRWRDEHTQRTTYYDGTPVAGPFNSEVMEDVLMMQAFGIPNGVYWIDRPWGLGTPWGYDDFEIDPARLPNFREMVQWLESRHSKTVLWITAAYNGKMATDALAKGYVYPGQTRPANGNNYPMVDLTNPAARRYWQDGIARLLALGVAGFKLDRGEENIPNDGPFKMADGRPIREMRNPYISLAAKAVYDVSRQHRGDDFFVMPRAAYAGTSAYAVFWGGDIGGTQEGLRASIIGVQRAAVMGYPNWGSDTCGYTQQLLEQEVCARWLAFSAFTPIMEVGPTRNVGFWNLPRAPEDDDALIATWRLYARLHERLKDYSYVQAVAAAKTGMPIVRPLFLADPDAPQAWSQWWTYQVRAGLGRIAGVAERAALAGGLPACRLEVAKRLVRGRARRRTDREGARRTSPDPDLRPGRIDARPGRSVARVGGRPADRTRASEPQDARGGGDGVVCGTRRKEIAYLARYTTASAMEIVAPLERGSASARVTIRSVCGP